MTDSRRVVSMQRTSLPGKGSRRLVTLFLECGHRRMQPEAPEPPERVLCTLCSMARPLREVPLFAKRFHRRGLRRRVKAPSSR